MERLQKVLAHAGVASRRTSEDLIAQGRVTVNGAVVRALGVLVDPEHDAITVDGRPIGSAAATETYMLHKPAGVVTTAHDPQGRPTVLDIFHAQRPDLTDRRLYPAGRLDLDTEGLLLLTNDGELALRLTHPRYALEKEYAVQVAGRPSEAALDELRRGVEIDDRLTSPADVRVALPPPSIGRATPGTIWLRITIHEGRKRQVRLMCGAIGHPVVRLVRLRVGPIRLGDLPPGHVRPLTTGELRALRMPSP